MYVAPLAILVFSLLGCNQQPPPGSDAGDSADAETEDSTSADADADTDADVPDDTSDTSDDTGGTDQFDYTLYPLTDGANWTYLAKTTTGQLLGMEIVDATEIEWEGEQAWLLTDNPNDSGEWTESVLVRDGDITTRVHKDIVSDIATLSIVDYNPGFVRADDGWDTVGASEEFFYERVETDGDGLNPKVEPRGHMYTVLAVDESVTVPAGTFDCVKVERVRTVGTSAGEVVLSWYAFGIGKVKEERPADSRIEELVSVSIPGGVDLP